MKSLLRKLTVSLGRASGSWLMLLLLLVVLVPSACLLWFMNQAVQNERLAVRQKLVDAYRGHLQLAQQRLESAWSNYARELQARSGKLAAPALFADEVTVGRTDSLICFDAMGRIAYPSPAGASTGLVDSAWVEAEALETKDSRAAARLFAQLAQQSTNVHLSAQAWQAQVRCLIQAGEKSLALNVLTNHLADDRFQNAVDDQGRWIAPNAQLTALELLNQTPLEQKGWLIERLRRELLDYRLAMPSAQRRFLMREYARLFPAAESFPTSGAEDLAARYIETGATHFTNSVLRSTSLPGVWQFGSSDARIVSLHGITNLLHRMQQAMMSPELPKDIRLDLVLPGSEAEEVLLSMPAGSLFPGWRVAINLKDKVLFENATRERVKAYVWIGILVVLVVIALAGLALGLLRRQMALTQLRNDLVANVTHELKTPLSSMRLLVETLLNSPRIEEQTARDYLNLIARENLRLSRLIDNFLTFSRIERNKYQFNFKPVAARTIAESAANAMRERFNIPGCHFETKIASDLPSLVADSDAMVTALLNLLDNAYKYSGDDKRITLAATAENGEVQFSVTDNGVGLSPAETKRVFKRFYQVRQSKIAAGGSGLGLSIVQFIVTAHGGSVHVESEPDRGSRFVILIPKPNHPTSRQ